MAAPLTGPTLVPTPGRYCTRATSLTRIGGSGPQYPGCRRLPAEQNDPSGRGPASAWPGRRWSRSRGLSWPAARSGGGSIRRWAVPAWRSSTPGSSRCRVAWLALGRLAITTRQLRIVGAAWCLPLLLTAPLFSQDAYSYLAQGTLVHLGIDPYRHAPAVLANVGQAHVLGAVDPFWRHTTAPYGPLFLWIVSVVVGVARRTWCSACC